MTAQIPNDQRRIIPRWRNSWVALSTGELATSRPVKSNPPPGRGQFLEKLRLWRDESNIEFAAEVVAAGLSQGYLEESADAAEFLMDRASKVMPTVQSVAREILVRLGKLPAEDTNPLEAFETSTLYGRIHRLRTALIAYPNNPVMWVDLARGYVVLGQWLQARDAMKSALILAPENRFVLRSAARLYVHIDEPDLAHQILVKRGVTRTDPWLLAAEIATANVAGVAPAFIRSSRDMLQRSIFHPYHTAELTSALASIELFAGSSRKARQLFESSLESPTENSVAQSAWARRWLPTLDLRDAVTATPRTYEARAWNAYLALDWQSLVHASTDWFMDEPFSSRPAEMGSFAASIGLEDHELAERLTRNGLIANPDDPGLINNLAFALANQGKLVEAQRVLRIASRPAPHPALEIALRATQGFVDIRSGNYQKGQQEYLDAISLASKESLHKFGALASIYYAHEMLQAGQFTLPEALSFAETASSRFADPDVRWLLQRLRSLKNTQGSSTET